MKIKQQPDNPFPSQACKDVYIIFAQAPRKIFSKEDVFDKSPAKYSRITIVDSLLYLVEKEYILASPTRVCYALNDRKEIKIKKEVTLNFRAYETANNH